MVAPRAHDTAVAPPFVRGPPDALPCGARSRMLPRDSIATESWAIASPRSLPAPAMPGRRAWATVRAWPRIRCESPRSATSTSSTRRSASCSAEPLPAPVAACLTDVQHDLFDLGGELSVPGYTAVTDAHVGRLEDAVEAFNADLGPLKEFILPGGTRAAAIAHVARTVCRRAERALVRMAATDAVQRSRTAVPQPALGSAVRGGEDAEPRRRAIRRPLAAGPPGLAERTAHASAGNADGRFRRRCQRKARRPPRPDRAFPSRRVRRAGGPPAATARRRHALGTLAARPRRRLGRIARADPVVAAAIEGWEWRLAALADVVPRVTPPPRVWAGIRSQPGLSDPSATPATRGAAPCVGAAISRLRRRRPSTGVDGPRSRVGHRPAGAAGTGGRGAAGHSSARGQHRAGGRLTDRRPDRAGGVYGSRRADLPTIGGAAPAKLARCRRITFAGAPTRGVTRRSHAEREGAQAGARIIISPTAHPPLGAR